MSIARSILLVVAVCGFSGGHARAAFLLTFEGLKSGEQVTNYYNGGNGSFGSGPGPADGVTFSTNALAYIPSTPFPGDPSPPTVLLLGDPSGTLAGGTPLTMTMDVAGGFTQSITFYDIAIDRTATVQVWSGPDGTGTMLAQETLPLLPPTSPVFTGPETLPFSGTANSVVFTGGNQQLAIDDISITPATAVPEPREALRFMTILCWLSLVRPRWRKKPSMA